MNGQAVANLREYVNESASCSLPPWFILSIECAVQCCVRIEAVDADIWTFV